METGPRLKVSSDRLVKQGIEPATLVYKATFRCIFVAGKGRVKLLITLKMRNAVTNFQSGTGIIGTLRVHSPNTIQINYLSLFPIKKHLKNQSVHIARSISLLLGHTSLC